MGQDDFKPLTLADIEAFECSEVSLGYCASRCRDGIGGGGGDGGYVGALRVTSVPLDHPPNHPGAMVSVIIGEGGLGGGGEGLQRESAPPATPYIQTTAAKPPFKYEDCLDKDWRAPPAAATLDEQATAIGAMIVTKDAAAEVIDLLRIVRAETLSRGIKARAEAAIIALGGTLDAEG